MQYIHTWNTQQEELLIHSTILMNLKGITLSENQFQKVKYYFIYVTVSERETIWIENKSVGAKGLRVKDGSDYRNAVMREDPGVVELFCILSVVLQESIHVLNSYNCTPKKKKGQFYCMMIFLK